MASITSMGLGSGLDISSLVAQLVEAEGAPVSARLDRREAETTAELSALGTLKSALSSLQTSLEKLDEASDFGSLKAVSRNEELFTATAGTGAAAGSYQLEVLRLAQQHKMASDTFESSQVFGGNVGDELAVTVDGGSMTLDLSAGMTLEGIRDAINSAEDNPGVTASLISVDDGHQVLTITSNETGSAHQVQVTETLAGGPSLSFDTANLDADGVLLADLAELDAAVRLDGVEITRSTSQIADVIEGVTINLLQAQPGTRATLSVELDRESVSSAISQFVGQYNGMLGALDSVAGYKGEGATQPALFGDAMTRTIGNRLREGLGGSVAGLEGAFSTLAEIGITFDEAGKLVLDQEALDNAISEDPDGITQLFSAEQGFAASLSAFLDPYLESDGLFESRTDGLEARLDSIDEARDRLDRRLANLEERYIQQYTAMDILVGELMATSDFLTQQFANLNKSE